VTKLPLKFVHAFKDRHGKARYYFRRPGFKGSALPGLPGSAEFMEAYQAALDGESSPRLEIGKCQNKPGSVAAAVALYLGSMDFGNLAYATRRDRRLILERFREAHGDKNFAGLQCKHVERMLAEKSAAPHAAKNFLKTLRSLVAVALRAGLCDSDPTAGIKVKVRASAHGFRDWPEHAIEQFEAVYPIGTRERLAFALLLYTGQRRGDVIRMGRQHVRGGLITVRQAKTGAPLEISPFTLSCSRY
jgi:hypothetical protein